MNTIHYRHCFFCCLVNTINYYAIKVMIESLPTKLHRTRTEYVNKIFVKKYLRM